MVINKEVWTIWFPSDGRFLFDDDGGLKWTTSYEAAQEVANNFGAVVIEVEYALTIITGVEI